MSLFHAAIRGPGCFVLHATAGHCTVIAERSVRVRWRRQGKGKGPALLPNPPDKTLSMRLNCTKFAN